MFLLPFIYDSEEFGIIEVAMTMLGEIPPMIIVYFMIDT